MQTLFIENEVKYTGSQLSPHWIYKNYKLQGDAIVSFVGEVDVQISKMVDIEDVINNEPIYSKRMLNFIIEQYGVTLGETAALQRLFISIIKDVIEDMTNEKIKRLGDDLFFDDRKLSVSIATKSITSCLIHTALNIIKDGALIEVSDLVEIGIEDICDFSKKIMSAYKDEVESIKLATYKVRGVVE